MAMTCATCGGALLSGARFCPHCGAEAAVPLSDPDTDATRHGLQRTLGTHFRIQRLLGRGGMGAVYLAHEAGLDRDVAIKVLPPDKATSSANRERFRREARTAARLTHPAIVPLHAFGEQDDMAYYVMGYVDGESLAARLRREGRLAEDEACRITADIARALHYAHEQGIVHRDVKPENILIERRSGRPLLTDFGIARAARLSLDRSLTVSGAVMGTPDYMSPEQAGGREDVDARSDVYSLGLTAYAMLAGRLPFDATTPLEAAARRLTDNPIDLTRVAPEVSSATAAAIMRCLARDPARRWPDAARFADALAPAETDPDELPNELKRIDRMGLVGIIFLIVGGLVYLASAGLTDPGVGIGILREIVTVMVPLWALLVVLLGLGAWRSGRSPAEIWQTSLREPPIWTTWYPRALRRRTNIWDRLPRSVRMLRGTIGGSIALLLIAFPPTIGWAVLQGARSFEFRIAALLFGAARGVVPLLILPAFSVLISAVVWSVVLTRRFHKLGLGEEDASQFVLHAPLSRAAFWRKPAIEALLAPAVATPPGRRGASPVVLIESIERALSGMAGVAGIGRDSAVRLVRHAGETMARLDRTIARLGQSADPGEADRLARKLEALGPASPGEPLDRAQMRDLVRRQLEIVRGVETQIAAARSGRAELAARLAALRDEISRPSRGPDALTPRAPAALAALERALAAIDADLPTTAITEQE